MFNRFMGLALAAGVMFGGASAAQAQAKQDFTLYNRTGYTIDQVYVAPTSSDDWESDVLGRDQLAHGESVHITFSRADKSCKWDLMVVWTDDSRSEWNGFDLCSVSNIKIFYNKSSDRAWAESD
jgi:hypothetical protein